jgi:hypothetical protein
MSRAAEYKSCTFLLALLFVEILFSPQAICQSETRSSPTAKPEELTLVKAAMCEGMQGQDTRNEAVVFPISIGKVFCFTSFDPVPKETFVYHNWYRKDRFSTRIRLAVKPPRWSTFSSVHLREADKGPWRVEITGHEGQTFQIIRFSIAD